MCVFVAEIKTYCLQIAKMLHKLSFTCVYTSEMPGSAEKCEEMDATTRDGVLTQRLIFSINLQQLEWCNARFVRLLCRLC